MTAPITIFCSSFLIALSGAMMPGPLLTVTISESARRGIAAGPLLIVGHGILELALVVALLLGLAPFLLLNRVFVAVALFGSAMLLWMAWGMFRALPTLSLTHRAEQSSHGNLIVAGVLLSVANPYWLVWWVSIGLAYILHSMQYGTWGVVFFFTGHIAADFFWYAVISAAVWKGKSLLSDRAYQSVIGVCAAFLLVFACFFAFSGIKRLIA